ncbi:MAG: hypothetical protein ACRD2L_21980, partial [Terriglobia bacterium]
RHTHGTTPAATQRTNKSYLQTSPQGGLRRRLTQNQRDKGNHGSPVLSTQFCNKIGQQETWSAR